MIETHVQARQRCQALVGRAFRTPRGVKGVFTHVLERPDGRPPVIVGVLPFGNVMKYTPSKGESLLITEEDA